MKSTKGGNPARLVAFFLIAIILISTVAFVANGWQAFNQNDSDSGNADGDKNSPSGETDNNTGDNIEDTPNEPNIPTANPLPEYLHYITGEEIDQANAFKKPLCFVYDSMAPIYGMTSSYLTLEIPTENGNTRFVVYTDDASHLGKIGALAPTRDYILDISKSFGGIHISDGKDDSFDYTTGTEPYDEHLDLSDHTGYSYTEYSQYVYTNGSLISALLANSGTNSTMLGVKQIPYLHCGYYAERVKGNVTANLLQINYGSKKTTELTYSSETGKYVLTKNSSQIKDMLNNESCLYDNVFVLFANCTTVETADATEAIYDTVSGGDGYYLTDGTAVSIKWTTNEDGNIIFCDESGNRLVANRGSSYVTVVKSSMVDSVEIK